MAHRAEQPRIIRDRVISVRASRDQRDLIDQAAQAVGTSRSDFMLDAAYREAVTVLIDQTIFQLDEIAFGHFQTMLDGPPPPSDELRKLLRNKAPWD